jgi:site-specific recombinase XerD
MSLEYRTRRWFVIYRPDGRYCKKVRFPVPPDQDPQQYHDDFIRDWKAAKGQTKEPHALTGLTIGQLWPEYLKWSELHHAATTHKDLKNVGQWIKKYLGQYNAEGIGSHHIGIYQRMRTAEAGRPINRTVNKELNYLGGMIRWAGKQGHITPRRLIMDMLPYKKPLPQVLTAEEVKAIIEAANPFYRAYLLALYALGLRSIEARNLKWKDINFERGTVTVVQKGGAEKSLPIGTALLSALKEILPSEGNHKAGWWDLPVFQNPKTGKAVVNARKAIRQIADRAGVKKRVTPHMLRHSCATHMLDQNVNLRIIQQFLGHSNISTTQVYTHVSLENLRAA